MSHSISLTRVVGTTLTHPWDFGWDLHVSVLLSGLVLIFIYARHMPRTRLVLQQQHRARLIALHASWQSQMPQLVEQYMEWKYGNNEIIDGPSAPFEVTAIHTFSMLYSYYYIYWLTWILQVEHVCTKYTRIPMSLQMSHSSGAACWDVPLRHPPLPSH